MSHAGFARAGFHYPAFLATLPFAEAGPRAQCGYYDVGIVLADLHKLYSSIIRTVQLIRNPVKRGPAPAPLQQFSLVSDDTD
jgi:hypothetical protein